MFTDKVKKENHTQNDINSLILKTSVLKILIQLNINNQITEKNHFETISKEEYVNSSNIDYMINAEDLDCIEKILSIHFFFRTLDKSYL